MKMESGKYHIIETSTILMDSIESELVLHPVIEDTALGPIIIKFSDGEDESKIEAKIVDNCLEIYCMNFKDIGSGTTEPIQITKIGNNAVKLHLWASKKSETVRKVEYTFFIEQ